MANVTTKAQITTTPWADSRVKRNLSIAAATYYTSAMIAIDAAGAAVKCDNTSGIRFDGIAAGYNTGPRCEVFASDVLGDKVVEVDRPFRFTAPIAAAVASDVGLPVYAAYDGTVSYSQSNSILVGWVDRVISATEVEIRPVWSGVATSPGVAFDGSTLTFVGSGTGTMSVVMPDNLADALSFKEGSNAYMTFITTDSSEAVSLKKATLVTSTSATAFVVGPNGLTNPTLKVVGSVSSEAGGLSITGGADAVGVALAAIGSNTNEPLLLDGKGSGVVTIGSVSTGGALVRVKVGTAVATASGVIGNSNNVNEGFCYVTGADDTAPVRLPASAVGKVTTIKNTVANKILIVFPPVSSQINALGANAAYNMPAGSTRTFTCVTSTLWYSGPETVV